LQRPRIALGVPFNGVRGTKNNYMERITGIDLEIVPLITVDAYDQLILVADTDLFPELDRGLLVNYMYETFQDIA